MGRRAALLGGAFAVTAMSPDQRDAVLGGASGPALSLNFLSGGPLDSRISFARASAAWDFNSAGNLTSFASNTPRFGYDPTTLAARGLLIEEVRTNSLQNNSMTGAVVGTPGTLPTNWVSSANTGLSLNVVAFGTDHGIPYVDIRINGTTATGATNNILFAPATQIAAVQNQIWTGSTYYQLSAGSLSNVSSIIHIVQPLNAAGAGLTASSTVITPSGSALASQRTSAVYTLPDATTAWVRNLIQINFATAPVAVDLTLRIGAPQLELGASVTSPILTTSAAVTRIADVASMPLVTGAAFSLAAEAEVDTPLAFGTSQFSVQIDDGSSNNRATLYRVLTTGAASALFSGAGSTFINNTSLGVISPGAVYRSASAHANGLSKVVANAGAVTTSAAAGVIAQSTTLRLGTGHTGFSQLNGHLRRVRYWTRVLADGELQSAAT